MCDLVEEYAKKYAKEYADQRAKEEKTKNIKTSVTMLRKHGIKDTEINDIMENYQLTREAALSYM